MAYLQVHLCAIEGDAMRSHKSFRCIGSCAMGRAHIQPSATGFCFFIAGFCRTSGAGLLDTKRATIWQPFFTPKGAFHLLIGDYASLISCVAWMENFIGLEAHALPVQPVTSNVCLTWFFMALKIVGKKPYTPLPVMSALATAV